MATQPDPDPDTIDPGAPQEMPGSPSPSEAPVQDPPGFAPPAPDIDNPGQTPPETPMPPD